MTLIRKAKTDDVPEIKRIIDLYARRGIMLFRPIYEIYGDVRDYFVAETRKKVIGCCALHIFGKEYRPGNKESVLAELKSLAVLGKYQGKGIGTKLTQEAIKEAKNMGINKIFTLTIKENIEFLKKFGFKEIKKTKLPQKIWQECAKCPRFLSECNEIPLILDI